VIDELAKAVKSRPCLALRRQRTTIQHDDLHGEITQESCVYSKKTGLDLGITRPGPGELDRNPLDDAKLAESFVAAKVRSSLHHLCRNSKVSKSSAAQQFERFVGRGVAIQT
jgi:hypothetical protein